MASAGRVQEPVINWMKKTYTANYVDMITEAGPNKILLYGPKELVESIKKELKYRMNDMDQRSSQLQVIMIVQAIQSQEKKR